MTEEVDALDDRSRYSENYYAEEYKRASRAFPELGYYPHVFPYQEIGEAQAQIGDAIDDLADIANDLKAVLWYRENVSAADAIWQFRFGYQYHWGQHLHSLRAYMNSSAIRAW